VARQKSRYRDKGSFRIRVAKVGGPMKDKKKYQRNQKHKVDWKRDSD